MWNLKCTIIPVINWSHWNSNEEVKKKFVSCTRKTFDRFTTRVSAGKVIWEKFIMINIVENIFLNA